jgi:hypothetical protein
MVDLIFCLYTQPITSKVMDCKDQQIVMLKLWQITSCYLNQLKLHSSFKLWDHKHIIIGCTFTIFIKVVQLRNKITFSTCWPIKSHGRLLIIQNMILHHQIIWWNKMYRLITINTFKYINIFHQTWKCHHKKVEPSSFKQSPSYQQGPNRCNQSIIFLSMFVLF